MKTTFKNGLHGEQLVEQKLLALGFNEVALTTPTCTYDIDVDGNKVEVKTTSLRVDKSGSYFKYTLDQPAGRGAKGRHSSSNGRKIKNYAKSCDVLVLVAIDTDSVYYFVIPSSKIGRKRNIRINQKTRNGKYNIYLNAFHNLKKETTTWK